jgi:hypothetical protein
MDKDKYIWYVGYGSNLCEKRFLCYIKGEKFIFGNCGSSCKGCFDDAEPEDNKPIRIPYRLYFAKSSKKWSGGGVAFLRCKKELDEKLWTWGRMWKITKEQYDEVKIQEESWYNKELSIDKQEDIPFLTITSNTELSMKKPDECYLGVMVLGLREIKLSDDKILKYFKQIEGIKGNYEDDDLKRIIELQSFA